MTIDVVTVLTMQHLIVGVIAAIYLVDVVRRGVTAVDRTWVLGFLGAVLTTLGFLVGAMSQFPWWINPVANGVMTASVGALWSGVRVFCGRTPRLWLPALSGVAVMGAALVHGPDGGEWAGGLALFVAVGGWSLAGVVASVRGSMNRYFGGLILTIALGVGGGFYVLRAIVALTLGFDSLSFERFFDQRTSTVVTTLAVLAGAIGILLLRTGEGAAMRVGDLIFDPGLGVRTPLGLERRAEEVLTQIRARGQGVAVVVLDLADPATLVDAYGPRMMDAARGVVAAILLERAPRGAVIGASDAAACRFVVVLADGSAESARPWAAEVGRTVRESRVEVDGDVLRLSVRAGVAVAGADASGDALPLLVRRATDDLGRRPAA